MGKKAWGLIRKQYLGERGKSRAGWFGAKVGSWMWVGMAGRVQCVVRAGKAGQS